MITSFPARADRPVKIERNRPAEKPTSVLTNARATVTHYIDGFPQFAIEYDTADGKTFRGTWNSKRPLLSANSKLKKAAGRYRAIGLAMAPWKFAGGGNLCAMASQGCISACNGLWAGMNVTTSTRFALIGRARLYLEFRDLFLIKLKSELERFEKLCLRTGRIPAVRLNVSTDIPWEKTSPHIFADRPRTRFYDYTAYTVEARRILPPNYQLCHSWKEHTTFSYVESVIAAGRNIVVPFDSAYAPSRRLFGALPEYVVFQCKETGRELKILCNNADKNDIRMRETDGAGVCNALHGKSGRGKVNAAVDSGFMRHHAEGSTLRKKTVHIGTVLVQC